VKILLKAFLLTAPINFAYAAEGQKSAGLPQMDIATFPSQLFWLVITFSLLYLFMWKFVIPRLGATIEERRDKISNDINDADNLNTEATDILKKYDEQMASASQESNEIITNSKKAMLDHLEMLKKENEDLNTYKKELNKLLKSKKEQIKELNLEFTKSLEIFSKDENATNRKTVVNTEYKEIDYSTEEFESKDPVTVILSKNGWIKTIKGHQDDYTNVKYKEGDAEKFIIKLKNNSKLLLFSTLGKFYTINCNKISAGRGFGDPVSLLIDKNDNEEILFATTYEQEKEYLITSSAGKGFFVNTSDLMASTKSGKRVMNLKGNEKAISCFQKKGDLIAVFSGEKKAVKLLIFDHSEIPLMQKGRGVTLQKFKSGKTLSGICFDSKEGILNENNGKTLLAANEIKKWLGKRAHAGKIEPKSLHSKI